MTEDELDALLKKPLVGVADSGFSRDVAARMERSARLGAGLDLAALLVTLLLVVLFAPLGRLVAPFEALGINLALSLPFAIACAALALSFGLLRWTTD